MPRQRTPARPKPVEVGELRAHAMDRWRRDPQGRAEFYWRVRRRSDRATVWTGWARRADLTDMLSELIQTGRAEPARDDAGRSRRCRTVRRLLGRWLGSIRTRADLAPATVNSYEKAARHHVAWLGKLSCIKVRRATLEEYRDARLAEGASPRTVKLELTILRIAWRWGAERSLVPAQDFGRIPVKVDGYRLNHRTPRHEEVRRVIDALPADGALAVELAAVTGARVSEICQLTIADLDIATGDLRLDGKTGERVFPLPDDLARRLVSHFDAHPGPLVPGARTVATQKVRTWLTRACKQAGVERFTPHGLRRMVVDRMATAGVEPATAAALTGHSVEVMLKFYREVRDEDRRRAVAQAALGELGGADRSNVIDGPWGRGAMDAVDGRRRPERVEEPDRSHPPPFGDRNRGTTGHRSGAQWRK